MRPVRPAIPGPFPVAGEALAGERLVHRPEDRPAVVLEPDQRAPHRQTGDEGTGAVDRIEHPDVFGIDPLASVLLAEDAVLWPHFADQRPHRRFRRPVGDGDRIEGPVGMLVLDRQLRPEMRQDRLARDLRQSVEEGDEVVAAGGIVRAGLGHGGSLRLGDVWRRGMSRRRRGCKSEPPLSTANTTADRSAHDRAADAADCRGSRSNRIDALHRRGFARVREEDRPRIRSPVPPGEPLGPVPPLARLRHVLPPTPHGVDRGRPRGTS